MSVTLLLRVPVELKRRIRRAAKLDKRSVNMYVQTLIVSALDREIASGKE